MTHEMSARRLLLAFVAVVFAAGMWAYGMWGDLHYRGLICTTLVAFAARELYLDRRLARTELSFTSKRQAMLRKWALRNIALVPLSLLAITVGFGRTGAVLLAVCACYALGYGLWISRRKSQVSDSEHRRLVDLARQAERAKSASP